MSVPPGGPPVVAENSPKAPAQQPQKSPATAPAGGKNGDPAPAGGKNGDPAPADGENGDPAPAGGKNGVPAPTDGKNGAPAPTDGKNGDPAPTDGKNGVPAPADGGKNGDPAPTDGKNGDLQQPHITVIDFYGSPKSVDDVPAIKMYGYDFRDCVLKMHQAITKYGAWEKVKPEPKGRGFMYSSPAWQTQIEEDPLVLNCGHSGATLGQCWRLCQQIARYGWQAFVAQHQNSDYNPFSK